MPSEGSLIVGRRLEICIDANAPERLRPFWAAALAYEILRTEEGALDLVDPAGVAPTLWFQQVPERKTDKNRVHVDIWVDRSEFDGLRDELLALGGRVVSEHDQFTVLRDPEGNELCLCWPHATEPHATEPHEA